MVKTLNNLSIFFMQIYSTGTLNGKKGLFFHESMFQEFNI
jgi:hypothetical protein